MNGNSMTPETEPLFFETFEHVGLSKTYGVDVQVVDSAASAVAMFTGIKTNIGSSKICWKDLHVQCFSNRTMSIVLVRHPGVRLSHPERRPEHNECRDRSQEHHSTGTGGWDGHR